MQISDLEFEPHPVGIGTIARVQFENGYGASVITGPHFYTTPNLPYEVAVMYDGQLTYDTPVTDNVVGYCNENRANEVLAEIEALPTPNTSDEPRQPALDRRSLDDTDVVDIPSVQPGQTDE